MRAARVVLLVGALAGLLTGAAACDSGGERANGPAGRPQDRPTGGSSAAAPPVASPDPRGQVIEGAFVDIRQYAAVSKFRSCEGHDFSGRNIQGKPESARSMKHYLQARPTLVGSTGKLAVRAPFDGTVGMLEPDQRGQRLGIVSARHPNWMLLFFHTDPAPGLRAGSSVTLGQTVGYGNLSGGAENFDVTLKWFPGGNSQEERWDSPFLHLTDAASAKFGQHGVRPETVVTSKAKRDEAPCRKFRRAAENWTTVR
ncbi:hypothetical protein AB0M36_34880 [Actinoplanes sp. NPDC051346]|uniref:hypothetical protein n=1 Tax=Actinoplanes sp. NPDC051346 TaxID=3155048 RepID=UPI0034385986